MTNEEHFRKLERMYLSAPINEIYSPSVSISQGEAEIRTEVKPDFFHSAGALHGAVYFKLLDDAAFFAANSLVQDCFILTVSFNLHLMRPVSKGILVSKGHVISGSINYFVAESVLTVDNKEVAKGTGSFLRSRIKLSEVASYK